MKNKCRIWDKEPQIEKLRRLFYEKSGSLNKFEVILFKLPLKKYSQSTNNLMKTGGQFDAPSYFYNLTSGRCGPVERPVNPPALSF